MRIINNYSTRARWIWNDIIIRYPASSSRIIVLLKLNHYDSYKIKKWRKNEKRDKKVTRIGHMTEQKRRQNLAKCCSVYFQSWMNQWNCSEVNEVLGKKSSHYRLWNVVRVWFFLKHVHCCNHRSKRIEVVRFHHINCRSRTEQVYNPFVQRRHNVPVCSSWRKSLNLNR